MKLDLPLAGDTAIGSEPDGFAAQCCAVFSITYGRRAGLVSARRCGSRRFGRAVW